MTWKTYSIAQIIEDIQSGFACGNKDVVNGFLHLRMNNIHSDGKLDLTLLRRVPPELVGSKYRLKKGDVVVCTTNSGKLVGKSALFDIEGEYAFSNHLTRLRIKKDIAEPTFVQKLLWLKWQLGEIEPLCKHWVNQSTLPKEALLALEFQLPPLVEQRRIARKLDCIAAHLDEVKARLAKIPSLLKRFRQSILAAACSGRLTEDWRLGNSMCMASTSALPASDDLPELPDSWRYDALGSVIYGTKYGTAKRCDYKCAAHAVLRIPNIGDGYIIGDDLKYTDLSEREYQQLALEPGDILLIRSNGSVSLVGRSALVTREFAGYAYAGYLIRIRPRKEIIVPEYLNRVLASFYVRLQIEIPARSTSGVNNINSEEVANLRIPLPPVEEQNEIVRRVESLMLQADAIEARYNKAMAFVDKLMPSILAKAFRGELS